MKEIKRVMACVDLSDYSRMTVEHTLAVVKGLRAEILLFNVINNKDLEAVRTVSPYFPGNFSVESYIEKAKTERQQKIKEMAEQHFPADKPQMNILIHVGIPFEAILRAIEEEQIDLVVIANKGKSNLIGTLHGSNGEKVFRHSPVPVLSARNRKRFGRNRQTGEMITENIKQIVVGIDFSVYTSRILEYAAGIAERNSAEIIAVSVINKRQIEYIKTVVKNERPSTLTLEKFINDETGRRIHKINDLIHQWVPQKVSTSTIIKIGVPFEEILKVVDEAKAHLVVINSKGRTNFQDYMFGTTSEKIFRHCPVSILSLNLRE